VFLLTFPSALSEGKKRGNPSMDSLIKIANALGVKVEDLFPHEADIFPQFSS
jgi:transcriptional regulator with XRE-family HTH domain